MPGKTDVFRVVYNDGSNHTALVFQDPVEGKTFHAKEMFNLDAGAWATVNDEGNIPHREPTGVEGEDLGLTWHWQK